MPKLLSGHQHWERAKLLKRKANKIQCSEERRRYYGRQQLHAALALLAWRKERDQAIGAGFDSTTAPSQIGPGGHHGDQ
jgi:hypothetical protein